MTAVAHSPRFLQLLAHDLRWQMLQALSHSDLRVQELASITRQPQNLVSYHLGRLLAAGLVREHRSIADGRAIYYSLHLQQLKHQLQTASQSLNPALGTVPIQQRTASFHRPVRVLFLCTHNSARSQMAEGLANLRGQGWLQAFSAGLQPAAVHPMTIEAMDALGIDTRSHTAKPLELFQDQQFEALVTVCDLAQQSASVLPASRQRLHWSLPDPLAAQGTPEEKLAVFKSVAAELDTRIGFFLAGLQFRYGT